MAPFDVLSGPLSPGEIATDVGLLLELPRGRQDELATAVGRRHGGPEPENR